MAYASLEDSIRLLEGGAPAQVLRLTRRVRHVPVALDRDGGIAVTMFLRRGVSGEPWIDVHCLALVDNAWRWLGGGEGTHGDSILGPRAPFDGAGGVGVIVGGGGVKLEDESIQRDSDWASWAELRLPAGIAALQVARRRIPVAAHGAAVVVWTSSQPPWVAGLSDSAAVLGHVPLHQG